MSERANTGNVANIGSVADIPAVHAAATPDKAAILHFDGELTYGALDRNANRVANGLRAMGLDRQSRVILLSKNDPRYFELFFGAARAGMALAPANWRLTAEELTFVIQDSQAPLVFVSSEYAPLIASIRADLPAVRDVIVFDEGYAEWLDAQSDAPLSLARDPEDDVLQLYTSGTTGLPKGAMLTDRTMMFYLRQMAVSPVGPYGPGTLVMVPLPLFHVGGACWGLNALYNGEADLLLREASAPVIVEAFRRFPVTKAGMVPAVMKMVIDHPDAADIDFSRLDTLSYGASPISQELLAQVQQVFACNLVQMFGMTESCSLATFLPPEDHVPERAEKMLSVGKAAQGVGLRIVGPDGADLPAGQSGEVLLSGENIMKGYWQRPADTQKAIVGGWYYSGDAGYLDSEGYLFLRDRIKDMIISGGENVYSAEVERVLFSNPDIADVAVIGVPHPVWGEAVKAVVVPAAGARVDEASVIAHARTKLAGYKCPKSVDFVDALPRNGSGKVLKRDLRAPYWEGQERSVA
ncbi:MAG: long-chain-fatty-acid--CoA ligase [Sphingobium sp.]